MRKQLISSEQATKFSYNIKLKGGKPNPPCARPWEWRYLPMTTATYASDMSGL